MDKSAIAHIEQMGIHTAALDMLKDADVNAQLALVHDSFNLKDLEAFQKYRNRFKGTFNTNRMGDFIGYIALNLYDKTNVFVSPKNLSATSMLDMGSVDLPGHCDHQANLVLQYTAAWKAVTGFMDEQKKQREAAEFAEDWHAHITFSRRATSEDAPEPFEEIPLPMAVAALRKLDIERIHKSQSNEAAFKAERGTFDSVEAQADNLPEFMHFHVQPHPDLTERRITLRISVLTEYEQPRFVFRSVQFEQLQETIIEEFQDKLLEALLEHLPEEKVSMMIGSFNVG